MKAIRHVGFDVDSDKIAVAVAEPGGEVRSLGTIPHAEESVRRLVKKLGPASRLRVCHEARELDPAPQAEHLEQLLQFGGFPSPSSVET